MSCTGINKCPSWHYTQRFDCWYWHLLMSCTDINKCPSWHYTRRFDCWYWHLLMSCTGINKCPSRHYTRRFDCWHWHLLMSCTGINKCPSWQYTRRFDCWHWHLLMSCTDINKCLWQYTRRFGCFLYPHLWVFRCHYTDTRSQCMLIANNSSHRERRDQQPQVVQHISRTNFILTYLKSRTNFILLSLHFTLHFPPYDFHSGLSRSLNPSERKRKGKWGTADCTLAFTPPFPLYSHASYKMEELSCAVRLRSSSKGKRCFQLC